MTILECQKDTTYTIIALNASGALKQRLLSFGVIRGAKIKYLASTNFKNTYEIQIGKMNIALRKEEAMKIEVN